MTGFEHYNPRKWVSVTILTQLARCPRRFFYAYGCHLNSTHAKPALKYGEALHKAVPEMMNGDPKTSLSRAVEAFNSIWRPAIDSGECDEDPKRNLSRAKAALMDFGLSHSGSSSLFQFVPPPEQSLKTTDNHSRFEVPFALDIGLSIPLVGRIDGIVRHRDTRHLWAWEFKTSSELGERFLTGFQFSPQACCYTLALKQFYANTDEVVDGCMVEGSLVATKSSNTQPIPIYVTDQMLEDFVQWAQFWTRMLLEFERAQNFPKWYSGCNPYSTFGMPGYTCDFKHLCSVPDWTSLKDLYTVQEYIPFTMPTQEEILHAHRIALPVVPDTAQSGQAPGHPDASGAVCSEGPAGSTCIPPDSSVVNPCDEHVVRSSGRHLVGDGIRPRQWIDLSEVPD